MVSTNADDCLPLSHPGYRRATAAPPGCAGRAEPAPACHDGAMRITSVAGTDLFGGSAGHPLQIVRVTVLDDRPPQGAPPLAVTVRVEGPGVSTPVPVRLDLATPA